MLQGSLNDVYAWDPCRLTVKLNSSRSCCSDLTKIICLPFDTLPDLNRDIQRSAKLPPQLTGGSHASRIANLAAPADPLTLNITSMGWRASRTAVESLVTQLQEMSLRINMDCLAVLLQPVDNVACQAISSDDSDHSVQEK